MNRRIMKMSEIFEKVSEHLLNQNVPCYGQYTKFGHRDSEGHLSAVGCLINEEHYSPLLEGLDVDTEPILLALNKSGVIYKSDCKPGRYGRGSVDLIIDLQYIHDNVPRSSWLPRLIECAKSEGFNHKKLDDRLAYSKLPERKQRLFNILAYSILRGKIEPDNRTQTVPHISYILLGSSHFSDRHRIKGDYLPGAISFELKAQGWFPSTSLTSPDKELLQFLQKIQEIHYEHFYSDHSRLLRTLAKEHNLDCDVLVTEEDGLPLQSIFDIVSTYLLQQGSKSQASGHTDSRSLYHDYAESKACAIGCLISREYYHRGIEFRTLHDRVVKEALNGMRIITDHEVRVGDTLRLQLLHSLQNIHDNFAPVQWEEMLYEVAKRFGFSLELNKFFKGSKYAALS